MPVAPFHTMREIIVAMKMASRLGYEQGLQDASQSVAKWRAGWQKDSEGCDLREREIMVPIKKRNSFVSQVWTLAKELCASK